MIKFNLHNVTNTETKAVCRVNYAMDNNIHHPVCVTLYAKSVLEDMHKVLGASVRNDSDYQTDYFEVDRITFTPGHPLYESARRAAELAKKNAEARYAKKMAKWKQAARSAIHSRLRAVINEG